MGNLTITSAQNPRFKRWREFVRHPETDDCPWLPMTGPALKDHARNHRIDLLFHSGQERVPESIEQAVDRMILLPRRLLSRLSDLESSPSMIGLVSKPVWDWEQLGDFLLVAAGIQDPGNLGTLVRTANATGSVGLASLTGTVSFFNAKTVRAAAGALFTTPFVPAISLADLSEHGYHLVAVERKAGESLFETDLSQRTAFLLGSEGRGLSHELRSQVASFIHVPMRPSVDSLNVAVAGALIAYELFRRAGADER